MWFWGLIASTILTALFLVIALAQIEAGVSTKSRWLALTFCSLALVIGLIIFKPKVNMEVVQYIPPPPPVTENLDKKEEVTTKKSTSKSTDKTGDLAGGEKSQGASDKTQGAQGQSGSKGASGQNQGVLSIQDQSNESLKSNPDGKVEYNDPVLAEILEFKRRAEEKNQENTSAESSMQPSSEADQKTAEKSEKKDMQQNQNQIKANVLVTSLNVRNEGSMDGVLIGTLNTGDTVEVVDRVETSEWIKIRLSNGQTGWVMKKYLKLLP